MRFDLGKFGNIKLPGLVEQISKDLEGTLGCDDIIWMIPDEFRVRQSHSVIRLYTPSNFLKKSNLIYYKGEYPQRELSHLICRFEKPILETESLDLYYEPEKKSLLLKVKGELKEDLGYFLLTNVDIDRVKSIFSEFKEYFAQVMSLFKYAYQLDYYEKLSYKDNITDLYNQRYLNAVIGDEFNYAKENDKPFSVLFIDIDYFKLVNDSSGHLVGSKVLIELSKLIQKRLRASDYAFRYGGDEFVVLLTNSNSESSFIYAENLRKMVEDSTFSIDGIDVCITISIGLASFPEHASSPEQILKIADESMYYGKNKSRNIVYTAAS